MCFNPRTHTGCDIFATILRIRFGRFNPRTHTGCDTKTLGRIQPEGCFNPRTHTGCDTKLKSNVIQYPSFNPRTHTGCDVNRCINKMPINVSIHAPTRGATKSGRKSDRLKKFQSTHPHGVRRTCLRKPHRTYRFQSTHPHGVRRSRPTHYTV